MQTNLHNKYTQTKVVPSISIENISGSDKLMHLYTGFPDFPTFLCFDLLGPSVDTYTSIMYKNLQPRAGFQPLHLGQVQVGADL